MGGVEWHLFPNKRVSSHCPHLSWHPSQRAELIISVLLGSNPGMASTLLSALPMSLTHRRDSQVTKAFVSYDCWILGLGMGCLVKRDGCWGQKIKVLPFGGQAVGWK